ncbi:MAG: hypothetical protein IPO76_00795 [Elusimicrobia bacterium]|jgi:hypothetical protein|nr:hypothetical protein [Elusimicrobiota bacterium]MBK7544682.1 hypothetical protein [Elusimicrobiota bacterium]MBK7574215.1 hypothetical protein [Elusimicrobiota bacterium]MBK7688845.1 hypothetical protein [Elusimicrobiota bacterium]MBK8126344.1 hypothetical protein [Elusimicrobiota bacterium]
MTNGPHSFHIPVLGTGFTVDTPLKVARFGISSVISLGDDKLLEKMRAHYAALHGRPHAPIGDGEPAARARRTTAYLNLVNDLVAEQVRRLRALPFEKGSEITLYFEMLPDDSPLKHEHARMTASGDRIERSLRQARLRKAVVPGRIDVNIMTKADRFPASGGTATEESQTIAALRGFATSDLRSSMVFSAGLNLRLYGAVAEFPDFFIDARGQSRKQIILKVSDYRSALTQGKIFAKRGLWVSEFRVESGLNCGGHAFPTVGETLGPTLEEFKTRRGELESEMFRLFRPALLEKKGIAVAHPPALRVTAQGGIGTAAEDRFLRDRYGIDGTGWGTPFLLVPEATTVDDETLARLAAAGADDVRLSGSSPLGAPFYTLRGSASETARRERIARGKPGSPCPNGYLATNTEFPGPLLCTASYAYQKKKIEQLKSAETDPDALSRAMERVMEKACLCRDLGHAALVRYGFLAKESATPAVCPGPNIAFFSKVCSLREMIDHIYGRTNDLVAETRPHQFINELRLYVAYLKERVADAFPRIGEKEKVYFAEFKKNLLAGLEHYKGLLREDWIEAESKREEFAAALQAVRADLLDFVKRFQSMFETPSLDGAWPTPAS